MGLDFNSSLALQQMAARDFQEVIPEARLKKSELAQQMESRIHRDRFVQDKKEDGTVQDYDK